MRTRTFILSLFPTGVWVRVPWWENCSLQKNNVYLKLPSFLLPGDITHRLPVTMAISSAVSTLMYPKHRGCIGEKILLQIGTIRFSFRCQNMIGSVFDSQPYKAHYTFWVSSALSWSSRVILISISSRNNDQLSSRTILRVKENLEKCILSNALCARELR